MKKILFLVLIPFLLYAKINNNENYYYENINNEDYNIYEKSIINNYESNILYNLNKKDINNTITIYQNNRAYVQNDVILNNIINNNNKIIKTVMIKPKNYIKDSIEYSFDNIKYIKDYSTYLLFYNTNINKNIINGNISYLVSNINWYMFYKLDILNNNEFELISKINISNDSGNTFKNIKINLISGNISEIKNYKSNNLLLEKSLIKQKNINLKNILSYTKYSLPYKITLDDSSNFQTILFKEKFNYKKINKFNMYLFSEYKNKNPIQFLNFNNNNNNLSSGNISIYKNNDYINDTNIDYISKNINADIKIGENKDLYINTTNTMLEKKVLKDLCNKYFTNNEIKINLVNNSLEKQNFEFLFDKNNYLNINTKVDINIKDKEINKRIENNKIIFYGSIEKESKKEIIINYQMCKNN